MSYILDALKKAEREKKRSSVPDILEEQRLPFPEKRKRPMTTLILISGLVSVAMASGIVGGMWYAKKIHSPVDRIVQTAGESSTQKISVEIERKGTGSDIEPAETSVSAGGVAQDRVAATSNSGISDRRIERKDHRRETKGEATSSVTADAAGKVQDEIPPPDRKRLYSLHDLPIAVREKLPQFTFSIFFYAEEPADRRVRVNGLTLKEGQFLSEGLKLEEILPHGVVFNYYDYRFLIALHDR